MKTFLLAAILASAGTPVLAQGWGYGNTQSNNCGPNNRYENGYQNYGGTGYLNAHSGNGFGSGSNYGIGNSHALSNPGQWAYRPVTPVIRTRGTYDPVHGDFHPNSSVGYGGSFNRPTVDQRYRGHNDHVRN